MGSPVIEIWCRNYQLEQRRNGRHGQEDKKDVITLRCFAPKIIIIIIIIIIIMIIKIIKSWKRIQKACQENT